MVINAKCNDCKEPTKYVVGFFDGRNDIHGCLYGCHNEECDIKQIMEASASKDIQEMERIQSANGDKGMYAGYIAALRRDAKVSMFKMAQIAGCDPAEYSAYEHERKEFDPKVYQRCKEYLNTVRNGVCNLGEDRKSVV